MRKFAIISLLACATLPLAAVGQDQPPSFCQRLAPQLGMKLLPAKADANFRFWKIDTATLGMHFFGGSSAMSMGARPLDPANAAEFDRLDRACGPVRKGAQCLVEGPARFRVTTQRAEAVVELAAGETGDVIIRNTAIFCRESVR